MEIESNLFSHFSLKYKDNRENSHLTQLLLDMPGWWPCITYLISSCQRATINIFIDGISFVHATECWKCQHNHHSACSRETVVWLLSPPLQNWNEALEWELQIFHHSSRQVLETRAFHKQFFFSCCCILQFLMLPAADVDSSCSKEKESSSWSDYSSIYRLHNELNWRRMSKNVKKSGRGQIERLVIQFQLVIDWFFYRLLL